MIQKLLSNLYEDFTKYDSKLDFNSKSILKLESNAKVTKKTSEIIINPL